MRESAIQIRLCRYLVVQVDQLYKIGHADPVVQEDQICKLYYAKPVVTTAPNPNLPTDSLRIN